MSTSSFSGSIDGFGETLVRWSTEVVEEDERQLARDMRKAGRECADELHRTSPRRTGRYARGWSCTTRAEGGHVTCEVHNRTDWQLTHLLEKGHEQFYMGHDTGHRYPGVKHIEPAYEHARDHLIGGM